MFEKNMQDQAMGNNEEFYTENEYDNAIKDFFAKLGAWFSKIGQFSFDRYVEILSESIDRDIEKSFQVDSEKLCCGGYIYFSLDNEKKYLKFKIEIYYKKGEQWLKDEKTGKTEISKFDPKTSKLQLEEIWETQKNNDVWKLKIDPPERK